MTDLYYGKSGCSRCVEGQLGTLCYFLLFGLVVNTFPIYFLNLIEKSDCKCKSLNSYNAIFSAKGNYARYIYWRCDEII